MIWKSIVKRTFPGEDGTLPKKLFSEQLRKLENIERFMLSGPITNFRSYSFRPEC